VALFLYLPAPVGGGSLPDKPQPVATAQDARATSDTIPTVRGTSGLIETGPSVASASASATASAPATEEPSAWQPHVSVEEPTTTTAALPKTLSPRDPAVRYRLVVDIQRQLKRVGCYWGRVDGSWGVATKNAMREFINRVNATLPLDAPDYVQLALIQSHADNACGACSAGQSLSASGRCVGPSITTQGKDPNTPQVATEHKEVLPWTGTSGPASEGRRPLFEPAPTGASAEPLPERMAIGGPNPSSVEGEESAPRITSGVVAAPTTVDPNVPPAKPSTIVHSSTNRHRGFAGDYPPRSGRERLSLPRRNLLMSLGGLY